MYMSECSLILRLPPSQESGYEASECMILVSQASHIFHLFLVGGVSYRESELVFFTSRSLLSLEIKEIRLAQIYVPSSTRSLHTFSAMLALPSFKKTSTRTWYVALNKFLFFHLRRVLYLLSCVFFPSSSTSSSSVSVSPRWGATVCQLVRKSDHLWHDIRPLG